MRGQPERAVGADDGVLMVRRWVGREEADAESVRGAAALEVGVSLAT